MKQRLANIRKTVEYYMDLRGYSPSEARLEGDRINLVDLLTDLGHWADEKQVDFCSALDSARHLYLSERKSAP